MQMQKVIRICRQKDLDVLSQLAERAEQAERPLVREVFRVIRRGLDAEQQDMTPQRPRTV